MAVLSSSGLNIGKSEALNFRHFGVSETSSTSTHSV